MKSLLLSRHSNPDLFRGLTIDPPVLEYLMQVIRRRLAPQPVRIRADVEVWFS